MKNYNVFARATTFVAVHALMFAMFAVIDGANARESSRAASTRRVTSVQTVIAKSGDKHHHRHGRRFAWLDRPDDQWLITHRCVVYRIGPGWLSHPYRRAAQPVVPHRHSRSRHSESYRLLKTNPAKFPMASANAEASNQSLRNAGIGIASNLETNTMHSSIQRMQVTPQFQSLNMGPAMAKDGRTTWLAKLLAGILNALHESRCREAARVIRRHQSLQD